MKAKNKKIRNWHAVDAHFRNSAGPMMDKRKKTSKQLCRNQFEEEVIFWNDFPNAELSESFLGDGESLYEVKPQETIESEMWEYYKKMRPGDDEEVDDG